MKVLVLGAYWANVPTLVADIRRNLGTSKHHVVEQHWKQVTAPKFTMLNQMLRYVELDYDYLIVCDDDSGLPEHFLDTYLDLVERFQFALAQPARTPDSTIHHEIVRQVPNSIARRTRFVEIGPLFSIRRDLFDVFLPFDEASPMGWGYDFVWPCLVEGKGLRMGIIDAVPIAHTFRPAISYDVDVVSRQMAAYLARHKHLTREEAYG